MARVYLNKPAQTAPKTRVYLNAPVQPAKSRVYLNQPKKEGAFNWTMNQLVKPVAMASNALEDTGKLIGYGIGKSLGSNKTLQDIGFDPIKHQMDVLSGQNKRTYSDITRDAFKDGSKAQQIGGQILGYGGDFMLDPLNKLKVLGLTEKGLQAEKIGKLALSAAEQAQKGQRALVQIGKMNVLPSLGNKVLEGSTKLNDFIRATKTGEALANVGSKVSGKIRPGGVSREEFKILTDAKTAARNTLGYTQDKAIEFAKGIQKELVKGKATDEERSALLHAIEKGDETLAPSKFKEIFQKGVQFKSANEEAWKALGGSTLDNYGLAHVATKEVAEQARKDAFKGQGGFKLTSTNTPQDIHRQWVKVDGKVANLKNEGIKYGTIEAKKYNLGNVLDSVVNELKNPGKKPILGGIVTKTSKKPSGYSLETILNSAKKELLNPDTVSITKKPSKYDLNSILDSVSKELSYKSKKPILGTPKNFTPEEILRSAIEEMKGNKNTPISRRQLAFELSQGRKAPLKPNVSEIVQKPIEDIMNPDSFLQKDIKIKKTPYLSSTNRTAPLQKDILENIFHKGQTPVNVEQATAKEINQAMVEQGKNPLFQEDLPIVAAKMGISTGKKQAATDFLKATEGLKSEEAKALANEVHNKMVNPESLRKAIQSFDAIQNIWKAQALVAPSYHIRNFAGNLWNNFLADVQPAAYALAGNLQRKMAGIGNLTEKEAQLVKEMEQHGILGTGQYGGDIAKQVGKELDRATINPLSQNFAGYKANKWIGSGVEDNAKIAHYLSKRAEGYGVKEAAESVKKYLFDYGDLTDVEKGVLKRVIPFYTWTSKNIPLQIQQFVENPGKFSKIATAKKDVEQGVAQPNEKYMSDYIAGNAPIRVKKDAQGNTLYFLAGAWLPAASALTYLSDPVSNTLGMVTPALKLPYENLSGKGTFFKNTLGQYEDIQKFPGQKTSYLGLDLNPMTVNNLRSIRALNELNNLNPGGIFGTKNSPSIFQGLIPNASNVRGGQNTPEISQQDRVMNSFVGKLQGYNPEQSQIYYDRDTQNKVTEYNTAINRALSNNQTDLASSLIKEMEQFVQQRDGKPNKALQLYNLLGDQYFKDQAANKLAEKNRTQIREEMKKQIRQGIDTGNNELIKQALQKDPTYAQQALKDAIAEQVQQSPEQMKAQYQLDQIKNKIRLNQFYTK